MAENKDTLIVCLSDMHSGSSVSVFPDVEKYNFNPERNHQPTRNQKRMYEHFVRCAAQAKLLRKGKRMIVVHNGDAIEGWHHRTNQVLTIIPEEQKQLHIFLMRRFLREAGFDPVRDKLVYIKGTEVHTGETEEEIAFTLHAEYLQAHDFVNLGVNGRKIWFTHQGANSQDGHTEGDSLRNWLKRIYWNQVNRRRVVPDMVVMGHFHKPAYNAYIQRRDDGFHTLRGMILPSWQMKTRYAYSRVPTAINEIGAGYFEITAAGDMRDPSFMLLESPNGVSVEI
jgi:hypothetical protein